MEKEVIAEWLVAASSGNAEAQYRLGMLYKKGVGEVAKSQFDAMMWLEKAAAQGHVKACYHLGVLYTYGDGPSLNGETIVPGDSFWQRDEKKAQAYFEIAFRELQKMAAEDDADALLWLSSMYKFGYGVAKDEIKAQQLLKQAAELGNPIAETMSRQEGV